MVQDSNTYCLREEVLCFSSSSWGDFVSQSVYNEIESERKVRLLVVIKFYDDFFEVTCKTLSLISRDVSPNTSFFSHKLSKEIMSHLFIEALHSPNDHLYIYQIKHVNSYLEKDAKIYRPPLQFNNYMEGYEQGFPNWSLNKENKELSCTVVIRDSTLELFFSKDDFIPACNTDHDGGWNVYTHEQHVVGIKRFPSMYKLQSFLFELINRLDYKIDFSISDIYRIYPPFLYSGNLITNSSVLDFFSNLGIYSVGTIYKTFEEGAYVKEDNWRWSWHGGISGAWCSKDWTYSSEFTWNPTLKKGCSLYNTYIGNFSLLKKLNG